MSNLADRFNARLAKAWNAGIFPTKQHLDAQNHYVTPRPARPKTPRPAVTAYQAGAKGTRPWGVAPETPQERIARERLANLAKAREALAAKRAAQKSAGVPVAPAQKSQEDAEMSNLQAQIAQLEIALAALRTQVGAQPATPAKGRAKAQPAPAPAQEEPMAYVPTTVKLVNHGKGLRTQVLNGTKVAVAWDGASKTWLYACGNRKGSAADRGTAIAQLNVLLANAGLPPVRA